MGFESLITVRPWIASFLLLLQLTVSGCAMETERKLLVAYEPFHPVIGQYSRNWLVCYPTGIGNYAGFVVGGVITTPFALIPGYQNEDGPAFFAGMSLLLTPVLAGGAITGSAFLPFSYLLPYDPCWPRGKQSPEGDGADDSGTVDPKGP